MGQDRARRRLVPSRTRVAGILSHLAAAERYWFRGCVAGDGWTYPSWDDDDADWEVADSLTVAGLVADYALACKESRAIAGERSLDSFAASAASKATS